MDAIKPNISLCMIAKNEEEWIANCIESVLPIVSEVILVDTGSSDRTCEIAASLGAKIFNRPWDDDFSAPRNLSIQKASADWILVLDADEIIAEKDLKRIIELTADPSKTYSFIQRHYTNDHRLSDFTPISGEYPELEHNYSGYFESSLVRLIPNHANLHYIGRVHELLEHSVLKSGKHSIINSDIRIHHYGHTPEVKEKKNKGKIYTPLGQAKLSDEPQNWKAYFELGVEHNNNGRLAESADALIKSASMNEKYVDTWINLGYVLCELQKYKEAVQSLQTAIILDRKSSQAYCNLGVVYLRVGHYSTAEKYFLRAIQLEPKYVNAYCNLGKTLVMMKRLSEAAHYYFRALELVPNCTSAKADLGAIYSQTKRIDLAEKFLLEAQRESPNNAIVNYQLGELYKKAGEATKAIKALTKYLEIEDKNSAKQRSLEEASFLESIRIELKLQSL